MSEQEHQEEHQEEHSGADAPSDERLRQFSLIAPVVTADPFDEFWAIYPKKVGKAVARKKFAVALRRARLPVIIAAVERHKVTVWRGKEPQYIPNPATWLGQERWEDEQQPPPRPAHLPDKYVTDSQTGLPRPNPEWDDRYQRTPKYLTDPRTGLQYRNPDWRSA